MKRQLALPEVLIVAVLCAGAAALATGAYYRRALTELELFGGVGLREFATFAEPYRSEGRASRNHEEWIVRDYFQDRRDGVFLDVGAHHYLQDSNTYFLETELGWSGVAIDALEEFAADYAAHRPRTRFVAMYASDRADETAVLFVPETNKLVASRSHEFTVKEGAPGTAREVPTTTLDAALEQAGIERIDFLSMDIELAEPEALAGFDIARYRPALVCIEGHPEVRQQILDYFAAHDYVLMAKYLRIDSRNLYFRPSGR